MLCLKFQGIEQTYLAPIIPLGINIVINYLCPKLLRSNIDNGIRIGLAFAQHTDVLLHQIFGLHNMNAQQTLKKESIYEWKLSVYEY